MPGTFSHLPLSWRKSLTLTHCLCAVAAEGSPNDTIWHKPRYNWNRALARSFAKTLLRDASEYSYGSLSKQGNTVEDTCTFFILHFNTTTTGNKQQRPCSHSRRANQHLNERTNDVNDTEANKKGCGNKKH